MSAEAIYIREASVRYSERSTQIEGPLKSPRAVVSFARRVIEDDAREHFAAVYLDGRHIPIAWQIVSIGSATQSLVHPREVFQPAILCGACALIVMHNHPSGNVAASPEDAEVTDRLRKAGKLLGIPLLDHIVWTRSGSYYSFAESDSDSLSGEAS